MSNEPTTPVEAEGLRLLTDAELDAVSGGGGGGPTDNACAVLSALQKTLPERAAEGITHAVSQVCGGTG